MRRPLIMVVDDIDEQRELYAGYLRQLGYEVVTAGSGVEAIAKAVELQPDLIVMDLSMPGLDGFDATRVIRALPPTKAIPVFALTAYGDYMPEEWAKQVGCDAYLRKPLLPLDLATAIAKKLTTT